MQTHTNIKIQRMNLNNGDNQRKACFVMFRVDLNILLTVTIVEVHSLNLDICVSLHDLIKKFLHNDLKIFKILKQDKISCSCILGLIQC